MTILTKNQSGFTLVELLIALVIFAVGILGVATMQITAIQGNSKGRQISEASNDGADRFEGFMSLSYDAADLLDTDGDGTDQDLLDGESNTVPDGIDDDGGNYGLDDLANPDGADDRDGDGTNDIFWNVATNYPLVNTKTIKVFIDPPGAGKAVEMIFSVADLP